jgi:hypothetical protein
MTTPLFYIIRERNTPTKLHLDVIAIAAQDEKYYRGRVVWSTADRMVGTSYLIPPRGLRRGIADGKLEVSQGPLQDIIKPAGL